MKTLGVKVFKNNLKQYSFNQLIILRFSFMSNISSASTALSLLTNPVAKPANGLANQNDAGVSIQAKSGNIVSTGSPSTSASSITSEMVSFAKAARTEADGLRDGSLSPFDTKVLKPVRSAHAPEDSRLLQDGVFVGSKAASEGGNVVIVDANFPDRRSATANAYHAGTALLEQSQTLVRYDAMLKSSQEKAATLQAQLDAGTGDVEQLAALLRGHQDSIGSLTEMRAEAQLQVDRATASLSRMFSFTGQAIATSEDGSSQVAGFTISHGTQGKIMEVSADGDITMFDKSGKAYTREGFAAAKPDGVIPGIHNDLVREADAARPLPERFAQALGRVGAGPSGESQVAIQRTIAVDISDLLKIDIRI
ncbi:hypothetical protein SM764_05365 [Pseudophaeobacter sp. 1A16562]